MNTTATKCKIIIMACGHEMYQSAYESRSDYFANLLEKQGALVNSKDKPAVESGFDYSYLIENMAAIPKDLHTDFSRAGVVAQMFPLTGSSSIVRLRSRTH